MAQNDEIGGTNGPCQTRRPHFTNIVFIVSTSFNKYKIQTSSKIHKILLNLKQEHPEQRSDEITGGKGKAGVCFYKEIEQLTFQASLPVTQRRSIHKLHSG